MFKKLFSVILFVSLTTVASAQIVQGTGGGGGGGGGGISTLTGDVSATGSGSVVATVNSFNGGTAFGTAATFAATAFAPAPTNTVITSSGAQSPTAVNWADCNGYIVQSSGVTFTLPASSTLTINGCLIIATQNSVTVTANGADKINGGSLGGSITVPANTVVTLYTDAAGNITTQTAANNLVVGSTVIVSGTNGDIEFNNSGVLGEKAVTGTGSVVLATSPTLAGNITFPNSAVYTLATNGPTWTFNTPTIVTSGVSNWALDLIQTIQLPASSGATNVVSIGTRNDMTLTGNGSNVTSGQDILSGDYTTTYGASGAALTGTLVEAGGFQAGNYVTINANSATITLLRGFVSHMQFDGTATITQAYGVEPTLTNNNSTVGTYIDYICHDFSTVSGTGSITNKFCLDNGDAGKVIQTNGPVNLVGSTATLAVGGNQTNSGSLSLGSGGQFIANSSISASTPGIAFSGDLTTGFYWNSAGSFNVDSGGTRTYGFNANSFFANNANGPEVNNLGATATNPSLVPNRSDVHAGMGADAAGDVSLIADSSGAVEIERLTGAGALLEHGAYDVITAGSASAPQIILNSTNTGIYSPGAAQICIVDSAGVCKLDYGITTGGDVGVNAIIIAGNAAGYEFASAGASSTQPTLIPDRASATTGFGASASGAISGIEANVEVFRVGTGSHFYGVGFGTAAANETGYLCYNSGSTPANELLLDTVTCLASLEWMKNIKSYMGDDALKETMKLKPFWYTWNQKTHPSSDKHVQPGLGAIATEKVDPRLVTYTPDGKLKGVRYEQMTALLVADIQAQQKEIILLQQEVKELRSKK